MMIRHFISFVANLLGYKWLQIDNNKKVTSSIKFEYFGTVVELSSHFDKISDSWKICERFKILEVRTFSKDTSPYT